MDKQMHTFAHSGERPSQIQRGLGSYNRDTIAYLSMQGVSDIMLERVADSLRDGEKLSRSLEDSIIRNG